MNFVSLFPLAELARREARLALEELRESGIIGKMKSFRNFISFHVCRFQKHFGVLKNAKSVNLTSLSNNLTSDYRKIRRTFAAEKQLSTHKRIPL